MIVKSSVQPQLPADKHTQELLYLILVELRKQTVMLSDGLNTDIPEDNDHDYKEAL